MKILDLDLDFFIENVETIPTSGRLKDGDCYKPWTPDDVRQFLENYCGLLRNRPIPGEVVELHDEVFGYCRRLIECGDLETPFDIVHIDAHADLGFGLDGSWKYVMGKLLHKPVEERSNPKKGSLSGLSEGNFLVFTIACQWIAKLTYVCHPKTGNNLPFFHFKDFDVNSGCLQLKKYNPHSLDHDDFQEKFDPLDLEPEVPFEKISKENWKGDTDFDFVFLAKSPKYTPPSADSLIDVIGNYIDRERFKTITTES